MERIQVVTLDIGEEDLDGCQLEMVRTEKHYWHFQLLQLTRHMSTPVIRSIVQHNDSVPSPSPIPAVQMLTELHDEVHERVSIVLATIDREEELTKVADPSYYVELAWPLR